MKLCTRNRLAAAQTGRPCSTRTRENPTCPDTPDSLLPALDHVIGVRIPASQPLLRIRSLVAGRHGFRHAVVFRSRCARLRARDEFLRLPATPSPIRPQSRLVGTASGTQRRAARSAPARLNPRLPATSSHSLSLGWSARLQARSVSRCALRASGLESLPPSHSFAFAQSRLVGTASGTQRLALRAPRQRARIPASQPSSSVVPRPTPIERHFTATSFKTALLKPSPDPTLSPLKGARDVGARGWRPPPPQLWKARRCCRSAMRACFPITSEVASLLLLRRVDPNPCRDSSCRKEHWTCSCSVF